LFQGSPTPLQSFLVGGAPVRTVDMG
jgi:hypothetical protein